MSRRRARPSLGVVVTEDRVVAMPGRIVVRYGGAEHGDAPSTLEAALGEALDAASCTAGTEVAFSLAAGLADVRLLDVPPLSDRQLRAHLDHLGERIRRQWPSAPAEPLVAPAAPEGDRRRRWIAMASGPVVDAVFRAAEARGLVVRSVAPVVVAWRRLLDELARDAPARPTCLVVGVRSWGRPVLHVLASGVDDGRTGDALVHRRLPWPGAGADVLAEDAGLEGARLFVAGDGADDLLAGLHDAGRDARPVPERLLPDAADAEAAAAWAATLLEGGWLTPARVRAQASRRARRAVMARSAAAIVLLLLAGGVRAVGRQRQLANLRAERAAHAELVAEALAVSERIARLEGLVTEVERLRRTAPRWSSTVAVVGRALPITAHLASLRGALDTVVVEAVSHDATLVFRELSASPALTEVQARSPVRRDVSEGGAGAERLTLAARVVSGLPAEPGSPSAGGVDGTREDGAPGSDDAADAVRDDLGQGSDAPRPDRTRRR